MKEDNIFLDTNILVYLYSDTEPRKKKLSEEILSDKKCHISTQVLKEFIHITKKKYKSDWKNISLALKEITSKAIVYTNTHQTILQACKIAEKYKYSFYDSLILTSALEIKCKKLYTEDLNSGQIIENKLEIINPY